MCPTMIEEGVFIKSFARQIEWTKEYLRGSEERSISKHVTLMMRSRYGYLRHVYEIIGKEFPLHTCFDKPVPTLAPLKRDELQAALDSPDAKVKGEALEEMAAHFFRAVKGLRVTGRRVHQAREEMDLCVANASLDGELWKLGALILVECKNWAQRVGVPVIRNFAHTLQNKKAKVGVLFTRAGVTRVAQDEIYQLSLNRQYILVVEDADLRQWENGNSSAREVILSKYQTLVALGEDDVDQLF